MSEQNLSNPSSVSPPPFLFQEEFHVYFQEVLWGSEQSEYKLALVRTVGEGIMKRGEKREERLIRKYRAEQSVLSGGFYID